MRGLLPGILAGTLLAVAGGVHGGPPHAGIHGVPGDTETHRRPAKRPARSIDFDAPTERWREGPVRYLLTKDEDDAFRLLKTDEQRAEFIRGFWASRDPDTTTPENEYRTLFYARVVQADHVFTDSTKPGWKTDRGKIFILLGPPDDFEQRQEGNVPPASGLIPFRSFASTGTRRASTTSPTRCCSEASRRSSASLSRTRPCR
ncbi:MAG: hypothetical protein DMF51_09030 [Acidobacteria bacterium]|nr:MAG: hypothetical protein DMF51_09030 [Acidobacteriota bacterium]